MWVTPGYRCIPDRSVSSASRRCRWASSISLVCLWCCVWAWPYRCWPPWPSTWCTSWWSPGWRSRASNTGCTPARYGTDTRSLTLRDAATKMWAMPFFSSFSSRDYTEPSTQSSPTTNCRLLPNLRKGTVYVLEVWSQYKFSPVCVTCPPHGCFKWTWSWRWRLRWGGGSGAVTASLQTLTVTESRDDCWQSASATLFSP